MSLWQIQPCIWADSWRNDGKGRYLRHLLSLFTLRNVKVGPYARLICQKCKKRDYCLKCVICSLVNSALHMGRF